MKKQVGVHTWKRLLRRNHLVVVITMSNTQQGWPGWVGLVADYITDRTMPDSILRNYLVFKNFFCSLFFCFKLHYCSFLCCCGVLNRAGYLSNYNPHHTRKRMTMDQVFRKPKITANSSNFVLVEVFQWFYYATLQCQQHQIRAKHVYWSVNACIWHNHAMNLYCHYYFLPSLIFHHF